MDDHWNIDGDWNLSEPWTGFTQFTILIGKPHTCTNLDVLQEKRIDDYWCVRECPTS